MFDFLCIPFSFLMKLCLDVPFFHYYPLALFLFALVIQIILLPLAIKQQKSQIQMAKIKPKEMAIREKYKGRNDRATQQKMTMEIQEMYQANGYNQFAGCLPLLIQLPIIFILFAIVRQPITYASDLDKDFVKDHKEDAVVFYEETIDLLKDNKEELISSKNLSEDEYNKYIADFEGYIKDFENEQTAEMELARLVSEGRPMVDELKYDDENIAHKEFNEKLNNLYNDFYKKAEIGKYYDGENNKFPDFTIKGINFLDKPSWSEGNRWLLLVPLFVFLTSFASTKLTRKLSAAAQQTDANGNPVGGGLFMEVGMPLISAFFTFSFAAAIGVYWIWRTLIGMVQSVILAKCMPIPAVTEEDIAAARKELKTKQQQKKKKVITIEVDEDDTTYDHLAVGKTDGNGKKTVEIDPTKRVPRKIEMLTDDEDDNPTETKE